jgi:branched-chain amino acid transport system substrate-binding protein
MLLAARLAVQEINASNMLGGRRLELDSLNDSAATSRAIAIAQQFLGDRRIVAVVGHLTSGTTIAAAAIYNSGRRPVVAVSPSASNVDLTGIGPYTFRVCATDLVHGGELARFAVRRLRSSAAAVIYLNDDYGRGLLGTFREEFAKLGGTITEADPMLAGTADLSAYLDHVKLDGRAQVLLLAADRVAGGVALRQARARGLTLPIIGGDALTGIQAEGILAEGLHLTSNWLPDLPGEASSRFLQAYTRLSGGALPDHRGAGAYDAVYLIARAIRDAGADRAGIRNALAHMTAPYDGVTGRISFDAGGDVPNKSVHVGVVQNGRIVLDAGR